MANSALALNALAHVGSDRQPRAGLLSMIIEGIKASRRRQAEQVVANYIQLNGGRLTSAATPARPPPARAIRTGSAAPGRSCPPSGASRTRS